jgi:hypothetical protein
MPTANNMRQLAVILATILAAGSAACGQAASPTSPAATEGSLRRIVGDISGGNVGTCSNPPLCPTIQGQIALTATAGTLATVYPVSSTSGGAQLASEPRDFDVFAFTMTETGRLAERGLAFFQLDVSPESATVWVNLNAENDAYFLATGSATPTFNVTADASCTTTGQRLQTTIVLHLPFLGQTEIVDTHCIK